MTFFYNLNKTLDAIREKPETTHGQLNERDMSRAAKGYEKYGKEGMEALAKAGREGKDLDKIRAKYDKYDESVEEGVIAPEHNKAKKSDIPAYARKAAGQGPLSLDDLRAEKLRNISHRDTLAKNRGATDEGNAFTGALKATPKGGKFKVGDKEFTDTSSLEEVGMTPKQKSFAKLAPPVDKITFADKIAGAKKEVDEMLGDVAAEAMKAALGKGKKVVADEDYGPMEGFGEYEPDELEVGQSKKSSSGGTITKTKTGIIHTGRDRTDDPDTTAAPGEKRGRGRPKSTGGPRQERVTAKSRKTDRTTHGQAGFKKASKVKEGDVDPADRGEYDREGDMAKNDIKTIVRHAQALHKVLGDDDNLPEWVQSKLAKIEGMMIAVDEYMQNNNDGEEAIAEKAVSKKQQKFMGMVHAAQKGGKPASKEVGKVAKSMGKKDAEDFASTKHKGLPEKAKSKKKEEEVEESSTTAGSVSTAPAKAGKGGMTFGKGIYDSFNRDVEAMISESMNISMSVNSDEHGGPRQTLTINATDEDAIKLGALLKAAGLGGGAESGSCGCGSTPCSCNDAQAVDENAPDYPTDEVEAEDNFEYSGGLNGPKSTGQTTVPVIAGQDDRMGVDGDDELQRIREMAGIKEAKKPDFLDVDKDGDKKEDFKQAAKDKEENKVKESIFDLTNQWKAYKG
jgi:hypothetical protein